MMTSNLCYPIGRFTAPNEYTSDQIEHWIENIASFPASIEALTRGLRSEQLHWKYRPDGWNIKQVVHHCADSHMNALIRFKLALTEDKPEVLGYKQDKWVGLADAQSDDLKDSLMLLTALHAKWVAILKSLSDADLKREFFHREHDKVFSLEYTIGMYAWHSNHHLAHVKQALKSKGSY